MQAASKKYKEMMRRKWRNPLNYIRVTIGLINQQAQAGAFIPDKNQYTYYSNLTHPLDNYQVRELYATCDEGYAEVDGSMYFLPRDKADVVLNQGIVSERLMGSIEIQFPVPHDIKGLTIDFGKAFPVDFVIESDNNAVKVANNRDRHFTTEEIFEGATYLRFVPGIMINGQGRFRIHQITMGIGIYFDSRSIVSATKKERISPIMEELHAIDVELTINNKNRAYDIENDASTVNFLEIGQNVEVLYGQEFDDGSVEWMPGAMVQLREWSADDETMSFSASDRFDTMDDIYYRGLYRPDGINLYDLAVDVMNDADVDSRTYWIDNYLKDVVILNPMPAVSHKEALQLIANAGRCVLYQDRAGSIILKSSFVPDMTPGSDNETYFSHASNVLDTTDKADYAMATADYSDAQPTQHFLPREGLDGKYLATGYVSEAVADGSGGFTANPTLSITLEAAFKCFGLTLELGRNHPDAVVFHTYYGGQLVEDYQVVGLSAVAVVSHEFPEFDLIILEFTQGAPHNRVVLNNITFGDSTDYTLEYGTELTKTPKGTQLARVREIQVQRTLCGQSTEIKELTKETIMVTAADNQYTFYFTNPCYDLTCMLTMPQKGQAAVIIAYSNYFATVEISGIIGACEVSVSGREYTVTQAKVSRQLNPTGALETWENPLVSDVMHAVDLADWIGDHLKADREYDLSYRGDPRIDANDIAFLENKYVPDLLLRVYDHTLKFDGALSGTIKARRDMSYVADTKNRLAGR